MILFSYLVSKDKTEKGKESAQIKNDGRGYYER